MPNYLKHYDQLCSTRKQLNRSKSNDVYYENHHIQPRSLGGNNDQSNLVLLTAREHFIAHLLLYNHYKITGGVSFRKMAFALVSMASTYKKFKRATMSSRQYAVIREAAMYSRLGHKVENTTNYKKPKTDQHREAIRLARLAAPLRSIETKNKLKQSAILRGGSNFVGNSTTTSCPHCDKIGQTNAMKRWHFDNCKLKGVVYA